MKKNKDKTSNITTVAEFLINTVYYIYSLPRIIIFDKRKEFCNQLLDRIHDTLGIPHHRSSSYNPQANSVIERNNRPVGDSLRHHLSNYAMQRTNNDCRNDDWKSNENCN